MNESMTKTCALNSHVRLKQREVPLFVYPHQGLAGLNPPVDEQHLLAPLQGPNCRLPCGKKVLHGDRILQKRASMQIAFFFLLSPLFGPRQSISALNLDVETSTSESSRACSCWLACLLLWKRPRRPRSEGWSGSAGIGTWSPGWGHSRAGCYLVLAAS